MSEEKELAMETGHVQVEGSLNERVYHLVIGGLLLYGFVINFIMIRFLQEPVLQFGMDHAILFNIVYIAAFIGGTLLSTISDSPFISFIGYNIVIVPMGLILTFDLTILGYGITDQAYSEIIMKAVFITGITVLLMMVLGSVFPSVFKRAITAVSVIMIISIVANFLCFILFHHALSVVDYIVTLGLCCYIGYDWARASERPKTLDGAVDSTVALYTDIVLLFLNILSFFSSRD